MKNEWNYNLKLKKQINKQKNKQVEEANKRAEVANKQVEVANKRAEEANKRADESDEKMDQMNQLMKLGIQAMLTNGMSLELISKSLSKSEDEIMELLKQSYSRNLKK